MGRPAGSENKDKPFRDALRMEIRAAEDSPRALRQIANKLIDLAASGDLQAIKEIGDRLDGKPAQESTVNINDKRDATDWTRDELVAFLSERRANRERVAQANGRGGEPDSVH